MPGSLSGTAWDTGNGPGQVQLRFKTAVTLVNAMDDRIEPLGSRGDQPTSSYRSRGTTVELRDHSPATGVITEANGGIHLVS